MKLKTTAIAITSFIAGFLAACFCYYLITLLPLFSMEIIPANQTIEHWLPESLVDAQHIQGIYRNIDIDSLVFTYHSTAASKQQFWSTLTEQLKEHQWNKDASADSYQQFKRSFKPDEQSPNRPDSMGIASTEVLRIAFYSDTGKTTIAYGQADFYENQTTFEQSQEGKWIIDVIWPMFNNLLKNQTH